MQKVVKITHVGKTRTGKSEKTGNEWSLTDVDIQWTEERPGIASYEQSCVATIDKPINREVLEEYMRQGKEIVVTMYVNVRVWEDKHFTQVRVYLPKEIYEADKPF